MTRIAYVLILLLSIAGSLSKEALGQTFTNDPEKFSKEVEQYIARTNKGEANAIQKQLQKVWMSDSLSDNQREQIVRIANNLVKIKARTIPDFTNLMYGIIAYPESGMKAEMWNQWMTILEGKSEKAAFKKDFGKAIKFISGLIESKSLYKTQSSSVDWRVGNYDFEIKTSGKAIVLEFKDVNLECHSKGAQIGIEGTSGSFNSLTNLWVGNRGKVSYERAGNDPKKVWVDLNSYGIDMKHPEYTADSVVYHNDQYLSEPLLGKLKDKVLAQQNSSRVSYPRFNSYNVEIPIKNIVQGVDYLGGFSQEGSKIIGSGTTYDPATLTFYRENKPFMLVSSLRFSMQINQQTEEVVEEKRRRKKNQVKEKKERNRIVSSSARVVIRLDADSIVHPGLQFNFYTDEKLVNLLRIEGDMSETPYSNSYHKVEMRFEKLSWNIEHPIMDFSFNAKSANKNATFESEGFFRRRAFEGLMGINSWHPLSRMKKCAVTNDTNVLSLGDITGCVKLPVTQVEPMLLRYEVMGFLDYNKERKEVILYPKLFHWVNSYNKKEDYEVIVVNSDGNRVAEQKNATLNLMNFELTIKGIKSIALSDKHSVKVLPDKGTIVMRKNRDFNFNGVIASGKVDFYGSNFSFAYDDFKLKMPILDSMQIWASTPEKDENGFDQEARVRTLIEQLDGELKIDHPENKSGEADMPEFPIFTSKQNSFAFYDKKTVHGGVYERSEFYFELDPFEIDSLDKFTNEGISFEGNFVSAGILPDIRETLTLQPDYSLGFKQQTPAGGYPLYGGKGTFENELHLSDQGLKGDGFIRYITSTAGSEGFYFFPKEVIGETYIAEIEEQMGSVEYPNVVADTTNLRWSPYEDEYFLATIPQKNPITVFGGKAIHKGEMKYTPTELSGAGTSTFEDANLHSNYMVYSFFKINADTAKFELGLENPLGILDFSSDNVKAEIDFNKRKGDFVSNTGASLTSFGRVQYQAFIDRFTWFMDEDELELSAAGKVVDEGADAIQVEGAEFISINPQQDSLRFNAKSAKYNIKDVKLLAKEVEKINVADAEIIPNKGLVEIHEYADMQPLDSSQIIANRQFRYHRIYGARTEVFGRWKYKSYGNYDYVDENGLTQVIEFSNIGVDTTRQTFAEGVIADEDEFSLSPNFRYKGKVDLVANRKNLNYKGHSKLATDCESMSNVWFSFNGEVDPNEILIKVDEETHDHDQKTLYASMIMPRDSSEMYGAFINKLHHSRDVPVSWATGYLQYVSSDNEYQVSSLEKLNEMTFPGNYAALNTKTCAIRGEGKLQLVQETGLVKVDAVGNYSYNSVNNANEIKSTFLIDFLFEQSLLDLIAEDAKTSELEISETDNPIYELSLREWMGKEKADEMIGKMSLGKNVKIPAELRKAMFFTNVTFKWNEDSKSYMSVGQLSLGNLGKTPVNMIFDGGIELKQFRGKTDITVYLEISPSKWYIFNYRPSTGYMKVFSSNTDFLTKMDEVKSEKKKLKGEKGMKPYTYIKGTKRTKTTFVSRLEAFKD